MLMANNKVSTGSSQLGYEYTDQWLLVINSVLKCALHYVQSATDLCVATDSPIPEEQSLPEIEATTSLTSRSSACSKVTSKVQKSNTSRPGLKKRRKKKKKDCQSEITFCDQPGNIFILLHIHSSCLVITNRRLLYI